VAYDIPLSLSPCPGSTPTVEPRVAAAPNNPAGVYTIVVSYAKGAAPSINHVTACASAPQVNVNAVQATNGQTVTVTLGTVAQPVLNSSTWVVHLYGNAGTQDVNIPIAFQAGDVTGNGVVNAADIALVKSQLGQAVTACNFKEDVNANCAINAADVAITKSHSGGPAVTGCPTCTPP
jgi:dockerin type I repeat protein